jgi:hypothetical protein
VSSRAQWIGGLLSVLAAELPALLATAQDDLQWVSAAPSEFPEDLAILLVEPPAVTSSDFLANLSHWRRMEPWSESATEESSPAPLIDALMMVDPECAACPLGSLPPRRTGPPPTLPTDIVAMFPAAERRACGLAEEGRHTSEELARVAMLRAIVRIGEGRVALASGTSFVQYESFTETCTATIVEHGAQVYLATAAHCLFLPVGIDRSSPNLRELTVSAAPMQVWGGTVTRGYLELHAMVEPGLVQCLFPSKMAPPRAWQDCVNRGFADVVFVELDAAATMVGWPHWTVARNDPAADEYRAFGLGAIEDTCLPGDFSVVQSGRFRLSPREDSARVKAGTPLVGRSLASGGDSGGPALSFAADELMDDSEPPGVAFIITSRTGDTVNFQSIWDVDFDALHAVGPELALVPAQ